MTVLPVDLTSTVHPAHTLVDSLDHLRLQSFDSRNHSQGAPPPVDVWFDMPGVWFADAAARSGMNLLLLAQCVGRGDQAACPSQSSLDALVAQFTARGVRQVKVAVLQVEASTNIQTRKSRELFRAMREWKPQAHFYVKMDDDVMLWPERMLHFMRSLEAAAGTAQPLAFGHRVMKFLQGHTYGLNAAAAKLLVEEVGERQWASMMELDGVQDKEDQVVASLLTSLGVPRIHCGHFVISSAGYGSVLNATLPPREEGGTEVMIRREAPKTPHPITLHKPIALGIARAALPDRLCVQEGSGADGDWVWSC